MRGFAQVLGLGNQQPMPSKKVEEGKERVPFWEQRYNQYSFYIPIVQPLVP